MPGLARNTRAISEALPAILAKERADAIDEGFFQALRAIEERYKIHRDTTEGYSTSANHYGGMQDAWDAVNEARKKLRP